MSDERTDLEKHGAWLAEVEATREHAMARVRKEVVKAKVAGTPITQIAKEAGLSRPTIYAILDSESS